MTLASLFLALQSVARAQNTSGPAQPAQAGTPKRIHTWWRDAAPGVRPYTAKNKQMPLVAVKGNKFVDPSGKTLLFRGLSISDPDKLQGQGHWNKDHFQKVKEMGAKLVRIPVHPVAWRERTPVEYVKLLDQAVGWCTDLDMYVIIDWHTIGNLQTEVFQDPMYDTTKQETYSFWRTMARHYAGHNTVAFFELFNEPTTYREQLGPISWSDWKRIVEEEITLVRASNPQVIPLVAGFDWAYDLTPLRQDPIAAPGIGYTTHPYSNKRTRPWEPKWEEDFGFAANKYPIIATEFGGFARPPATAGGTPSAESPGSGSRNVGYGPAIITYLESKGISWTVWCFDPEWGPALLRNWKYELNASGEFAKAAMHGEVK
jgi:endoglucanase